MVEKSHRWHKTAIAAAAAALLALGATDVSALSLGRVTVQSALGEPLRAEVDIPDMDAEESASLRARVASPAAFAEAGLEYSSVLANLRAVLQRRPDGRAFLRLTTDRAINDPFVDMILEASWASGRIVRDYTLLFDPPVSKPAAATPTLPQTTVAPVAKPAPTVTGASADAQRTAPSAKPETPSSERKNKSDSAQITVKAGDTAGKLAQQNKASDVSLDQMLVAMMRTNPDAFNKGNLNRLRAGAILDVPSTEQAKAIPAAEATQIVVAQSKDFNAFRRAMAENAPKTAQESSRDATGHVEARVDEHKPGNSVPDKLTLSKGALATAKTDEAKLAKERSEREAADRAAELARNIEDLNKLKAATQATTHATSAAAAAASAPMAIAAVAEATASAPAVVVSAPIVPVKPKVKPPASAPVPVPEPGLIDQLMEDPLIPGAGLAAALALAGGWFVYRRRDSKKKAGEQVDSSFLESRLTADSFFGASGGQQVDTAGQSVNSTGAPPVYAGSQLDSADDVDPVAEADVYLAYGRDLQAEEILKEALRNTPDRLAIHTKMLEIFAKRRDTAGFQKAALQAQTITGSDSPDWARIAALGKTIDPENPLYQDSPSATAAANSVPQDTGLDLDLDIDFSSDAEAPSIIKTVTSQPAALTASQPAPIGSAPDSLEFDLSMPAELSIRSSQSASIVPASAPMPLPELPALPNLDLDMPASAAAPFDMPIASSDALTDALEHALSGDALDDEPPATETAPSGLMQFDLSDLSLDLDAPTGDANSASPDIANTHETKLALADEFVSIGDHDGARALIEEVIADASGPLREKAEKALAALR